MTVEEHGAGPHGVADRMDEVGQALQRLSEGELVADDLESQTLDFKEDPATERRSPGNPEAKRAAILLDAAICFANSDDGGVIVLGVRDRVRGGEAFTGTDADADDIRRRIFERTRPNLTVQAHPIDFAGTRIMVIDVPTGLAVHSRLDDAATRRDGTSCIPLTQEQRNAVAFARSNPDHTARATGRRLEDLDQAALDTGRRLLGALMGSDAPRSDEAMIRILGLRHADGSINLAGTLLFSSAGGPAVRARHLYRRVPGGEPAATAFEGPLISVVPELKAKIAATSTGEFTRVEFASGQELPIPDFPLDAVDEAVLNAFAHRSWISSMPVVVDQSPVTLSVDSPGALPWGVDVAHLLVTSSRPRNPTLMSALLRLGLVERTSRGFERMWVAMLETGRRAPNIDADDFHVLVTFGAGGVDAPFVRAVRQLPELGIDADVVRSLDVLLVLKHLEGHPDLELEQAEDLLQLGGSATHQILDWMVGLDLVEAGQRPAVWKSGERTLDAFRAAGCSLPEQPSPDELLLAGARRRGFVTNRLAVEELGLEQTDVTRILRYLADTGRLRKDPSGPSRGPGVKWLAA